MLLMPVCMCVCGGEGVTVFNLLFCVYCIIYRSLFRALSVSVFPYLFLIPSSFFIIYLFFCPSLFEISIPPSLSHLHFSIFLSCSLFIHSFIPSFFPSLSVSLPFSVSLSFFLSPLFFSISSSLLVCPCAHECIRSISDDASRVSSIFHQCLFKSRGEPCQNPNEPVVSEIKHQVPIAILLHFRLICLQIL